MNVIRIKGFTDKISDFFKDHFVFKVEGEATFGAQLGITRGTAYLEGGFWTSVLGSFGWSNQVKENNGFYSKGGDGKGHNFFGANVDIMNKRVALGGNIDYVTDDVIPTQGELTDYYRNNGRLKVKFLLERIYGMEILILLW